MRLLLSLSVMFAVLLLGTVPLSAVAAPTAAATPDTTIGPVYTAAPELTVQAGVPQGALHEFTMASADSKIYPGIAKNQPGTVPYQRRVAVYIPRSTSPAHPPRSSSSKTALATAL